MGRDLVSDGRQMPPFSGLTCGCSATPEVDGAPICGATATLHVWVGPFVEVEMQGPDTYCRWACGRHATYAMKGAFDWHPVGGACGIPGSRWHSAGVPGTGHCFHELDQKEAIANLLGITTEAINRNLQEATA